MQVSNLGPATILFSADFKLVEFEIITSLSNKRVVQGVLQMMSD
jgi:hypothetical protein